MGATGRFTPNGNPELTSTTSGKLPRLRKFTIPVKSGASRHVVLRDGSMGFLLVHFVLWWHEYVQPINLGVWDEWGWAPRPQRGSSRLSEHAAGAAVDVNATRHPLGVPISRNLRPHEIALIRLRVRWYRGAIRWGGEWRRPDGMHLEIVGGLRLCERVAKRRMRSGIGRRILEANPGLREVIES